MEELILRVTQAMQYLIVYSVMIERSLQVIFDWRIYKEKFDGKGYSMPIALTVSFLLAWFTEFDLVSFIAGNKTMWSSLIGYPLTGMLLAQGSKIGAQIWGDLKKAKQDAA